jgi:hypothetical protein
MHHPDIKNYKIWIIWCKSKTEQCLLSYFHTEVYSLKKTGRKTTKQCVFDVEHKNKETTQMASKKINVLFDFYLNHQTHSITQFQQ